MLPFSLPFEQTQARPSDDDCTGVRKLVEAIGQAYERAKGERGNKDVLAYMQHATRGKSQRPLVKELIAKDDEFKPVWYTDSKFSKDSNDRPFKNLVEKVEAHTDVVWGSWLPSERSTDAAPIA